MPNVCVEETFIYHNAWHPPSSTEMTHASPLCLNVKEIIRRVNDFFSDGKLSYHNICVDIYTPHRTVRIICSAVCHFCMYGEAYRANLMRGFKRSRLNAEVQAGLSWSHGDVFISGDTVVIYNTWMDTWIHNMSLLIRRLQYSKSSFKQLH